MKLSFNQLVDRGELVPSEKYTDAYLFTDPTNTMIVFQGKCVNNFWVDGSNITCEYDENDDSGDTTVPVTAEVYEVYKKVQS